MKKFNLKLAGLVVILMIIALIVPTKVLAENAKELNIMVLTEGENYIIYVKDMESKDFDYALSEKENATDMELSYINSKVDSEGNHVALVSIEKYDANTYLYVKNDTEVLSTKLVINDDNTFNQEKMEEVNETTKRIKTEISQETIKDNQENGVQVKVTVGDLKITDSDKSDYYYHMEKLPATGYTELMNLAVELDSNYNEMDMYTRVETAKNFYSLYNELYDGIESSKEWSKVEDMKILQPVSTIDGDLYVAYVKKVDEDGTTTSDVKLLESTKAEDNVTIQGASQQVRETRRTAKLPITGDSMVLFIILAIIVIAIIVMLVMMKKAKKEQGKN